MFLESFCAVVVVVVLVALTNGLNASTRPQSI